MRHLYITVLTILFTVANLSAQQRIDPTVEVKRDFESTLIEIDKGELDTSINDTLTSLNLDFNYTIFEKPYRDMYEFNPLPSLKLKNNTYSTAPFFYAKVSAGYPLSPNAEVYFMPLVNNKELSASHNLLIGGYYNGFLGKLPLQDYSTLTNTLTESSNKIIANNSKAGVAAKYSYSWLQGEFNTGIEFYNKNTLFYGYNSAESYDNTIYNDISYLRNNASRSYNTLIANINVKSYQAQEFGNKFNYNLDITYKNSGDNINSANSGSSKLGENFISVNGEFGPTVGKYNQFLIAFESQSSFGYNNNTNSYGFLEFTPQYKYENGNIILNIGANISIPYSSSKESNTENYKEYHNIFSPHINLSLELAKNTLWFYAIAEGNNQLNNQSSLLEINNWYLPTNNNIMSSTPYSLRGGFKGKFADKVSYNLYAGFAKRLGMLQFIAPIEGQYFTTAYSTHSQFFAGGDINIKTESFNAGAKMEYSSYSNGKNATFIPDGYAPSGYAPFEALLYAQYSIRERVTIGVDLNYRNSTPFYISDAESTYQSYLDPFTNLSFNANYKVNSNLNLFLNCGNLLNSTIQYLPFYLEQGVNFSAGATIKF